MQSVDLDAVGKSLVSELGEPSSHHFTRVIHVTKLPIRASG